MSLTIKLEDIEDAIKQGIIPPPHVIQAQYFTSSGGEVVVTHLDEVIARFNNEDDANKYFVTIANGDADIIRTEKVMSQEVVYLVTNMVASSHSEVTFTVGGKKSAYRKIFIDTIEDKKLILLDDREDRIIFGYAHDKPCTVIYLESQKR